MTLRQTAAFFSLPPRTTGTNKCPINSLTRQLRSAWKYWQLNSVTSFCGETKHLRMRAVQKQKKYQDWDKKKTALKGWQPRIANMSSDSALSCNQWGIKWFLCNHFYRNSAEDLLFLKKNFNRINVFSPVGKMWTTLLEHGGVSVGLWFVWLRDDAPLAAVPRTSSGELHSPRDSCRASLSSARHSSFLVHSPQRPGPFTIQSLQRLRNLTLFISFMRIPSRRHLCLIL